MNTTTKNTLDTRPLMSLAKFCRDSGISDVTAWRWRRRGWLVTVNICGRQYITDKGLAEFLRRAESGEFGQECKTSRPLSEPTAFTIAACCQGDLSSGHEWRITTNFEYRHNRNAHDCFG